MIRQCQETDLAVNLRTKKSKLKYRISECRHGKHIQREMDVKTLYQRSVPNNGEPSRSALSGGGGRAIGFKLSQ